MTKREQNQATMTEAYARQLAAVAAQLATLQAAVAGMSKQVDPHWGHIGSLQHVNNELRDIIDFVTRD